ncbi:hypothetical protein [Deinococcus sonorensis]|uniref:Uncharacterized protein n=1 Tax=Deinococcus sonorensis KR-87 TaxID=694439 RepID=A0AAU7U663_9DEIO
MRELTRGYAQAVIGWQTRRDTQTPEVDSAYPTVQLDGRQQVHTSEPEVRPPDGPHPPSMRLRTVRRHR